MIKKSILGIFGGVLLLLSINTVKAQTEPEPAAVLSLFNNLYSCHFYDAGIILSGISTERTSTDPDVRDICIANYHWWQIATSKKYSANRAEMVSALDRIIQRHSAESPDKLDEDAIFAVIHAYAYKTRLEMHEDNYLKGAAHLNVAVRYLEEVLPRAEESIKFTLLAGLYHYVLGSVLDKYPVFSPLFVFAPHADKDKGINLLLECTEDEHPLIRTEARYFIMRVRHEIYKDYDESDKIAKELLSEFHDNQFFRSYRINILADANRIPELRDEYHKLGNFYNPRQLSLEQQTYIREETDKFLRKKNIKF